MDQVRVIVRDVLFILMAAVRIMGSKVPLLELEYIGVMETHSKSPLI